MCTIFGWNHRQRCEDVRYILKMAEKRGRDGWGIWYDGKEARGLGQISEAVTTLVASSKKVVGNFRATPTTETESEERYLQPYQGVVHNGTIANDKEFGVYPIDSMVLGGLMSKVSNLEEFRKALQKITGSYAISFFRGNVLYLGANYKPIHWRREVQGVCFASQPYMLPFDSVPFPPYHIAKVIDGGWQISELPRTQTKEVAVACSGGLDSVTVLYWLRDQGYKVTIVHFNYGCLAEEKEVERVWKIAINGGFKVEFISIPKVILAGTLMNGHYYSNDTGLAGAEYAHDWVSARNLVMLSLLTAFAESHGMGFIAFGGNLEESGAYPDNEEEFGRRFNEILPFATQNGVKIELIQPVAHLMKHEIVKMGLALDVPYELTWSCYGKGEKHCGKCGPCFMRKTAFERNGVKDPCFTDET